MAHPGIRWTIAVSLAGVLTAATRAEGFCVLAHEAIVDAVWQDQIVPTLKARFPGTSESAIREALAYAYGGSLIQDLGYYPFGSRRFSNLVHYVRSGDFVEALVHDSQDVNEYAFALGALAHYAGDSLGHSIAVNRVVPIIYPKLRAKYGDEVLYADSPPRHVMVEFAFDVLEVARGAFKSDVYQERIGFEVAKPVLERAFRDTYGLELEDVFGDADLAIGTYRRAVSTIIPDMTRLAWREKHDEILAATPNITERDVVYTMTRRQYEDAFGTTYRKPGFLARLVVTIFKIVPKFGPFRPLAFTPLTPGTEQMFREGFAAACERFGTSLRALRTGRLALSDVDLDTGRRSASGANPLADETYADLLKELARRKFGDVPAALGRNINEHYAAKTVPRDASRKIGKQEQEASRNLAALNASAPQPR
jgi:zinc dependent phospholipase C